VDAAAISIMSRSRMRYTVGVHAGGITSLASHAVGKEGSVAVKPGVFQVRVGAARELEERCGDAGNVLCSVEAG
jgi:hypothetical protein